MVLVLRLLLFITILLLLFCFWFLGFALHNIHVFHDRLFLLFLLIFLIKKKEWRKEKCVLNYFSWTCNQGWPYYLYITCLCTLFSLDELILLHFASFSYVEHVVWKLFIVFYHLILILKSHVFNCLDLNLMKKA